MVVPGLDLIVVRNGERLDPTLPFDEALDRFVVAPCPRDFDDSQRPLSTQSGDPRVQWAPRNRSSKGKGSDTWPMTWADDDASTPPYGDGQGFDPPSLRS